MAMCWNNILLSFVVGVVVVWACEDMDNDGCANLVALNPELCEEDAFSHASCPKTCGTCELECYQCEEAVEDYLDCNETMTCDAGQKCLLTQLTSSVDGHNEYQMTCASVDMCDGRTIFGRRDLSSHCCDEDLCNRPDYMSPTDEPEMTSPIVTSSTLNTDVSSSVTAVPLTTIVPRITCARDVLILIEDSTDDSADYYIQEFLLNVINEMNIGPDDNLVSVALFDNTVHSQWHLTNYMDAESLMQRVHELRLRHHTDVINYSAVSEYINSDWPGDRDTAPDVVIAIADHDGTSTGFGYGMHHGMHAGMGMHWHYSSSSTASSNSVILSKLPHKMIAVNVGNDAITTNAFGDYADDVYDIDGQYELLSTIDRLVEAFCQ